MACAQELCEEWTGDGCICDVLGIGAQSVEAPCGRLLDSHTAMLQHLELCSDCTECVGGEQG